MLFQCCFILKKHFTEKGVCFYEPGAQSNLQRAIFYSNVEFRQSTAMHDTQVS